MVTRYMLSDSIFTLHINYWTIILVCGFLENTLVMKITSCSWDKNSYITANFTSINQGHTLYQASYWLVILE